jgi:hypothetical protein
MDRASLVIGLALGAAAPRADAKTAGGRLDRWATTTRRDWPGSGPRSGG